MLWSATATQPQRKERRSHGEFQPEDHAQATAYQKQAAAAPEANQEGMEDRVKALVATFPRILAHGTTADPVPSTSDGPASAAILYNSDCIL
jgi:hypothetical protein